jgi:hypothetical protein
MNPANIRLIDVTTGEESFRLIGNMHWLGLICLVGIFLFIPLHLQQASRSINKVELMKFSNQIVQPYMQGKESWSFVYHSENPGIQELKNSVLKIDDRNKHAILDQLNDYTYMWSVRYLTSPDSKTICDVNYSFQNELIGMKCDAPVQKKSFQDWVLAIKEPSENWTLLNLDKVDDDLIYYKYNIASEKPSMISKTAHMAFQNQQLLSFKKQINYFTQSKSIQEEPRNHWINVAYAIFATLVLGLFSKTVLATVRAQNFYERKSMIASVITVILYLLWLSNSYRETLMQYGTGITLNHFITNQSLIVCIKMIVLWFGSYLLFYSFFHIPSQVFGYVPSSKEWNNVLKRPIWMWRNAKVSLLYALLLLLIQLLLRALVQVNNGLTELDLFHFDISYLNHEFLFISFLCLLWKNMMVWMVLLIIISILEKTFPRWIYMAVLAVVLSLNIVMSNQNLNSMLIEFCGIYIVFYFIYNIARFDFAFYFWFVLFNTLSTFIPILLYPGKYSPYIYHVVFVFIFVIAMMLFTLFHSFRHKITMQEPNRIGE